MKYFTRELWRECGSTEAHEQWMANCKKYQNYLDSLLGRSDIQELRSLLQKYHGFHDYVVEHMVLSRADRTMDISLRYYEDIKIILHFSGVEKVNLFINELIDDIFCMRWGYPELEAHDNGRIGLSVVFDWENEMEIVFERVEIKEEAVK